MRAKKILENILEAVMTKNVRESRDLEHEKKIIAQEFASDVLHLDPETGKKMSYKQLLHYISKQAHKYPRILELLLIYWLGKPEEYIHVEYGNTVIRNGNN